MIAARCNKPRWTNAFRSCRSMSRRIAVEGTEEPLDHPASSAEVRASGRRTALFLRYRRCQGLTRPRPVAQRDDATLVPPGQSGGRCSERHDEAAGRPLFPWLPPMPI